MIVIKIKNSKL